MIPGLRFILLWNDSYVTCCVSNGISQSINRSHFTVVVQRHMLTISHRTYLGAFAGRSQSQSGTATSENYTEISLNAG